ncbi:MAG TPA: ABC transporter substrate-binding protein [Stellaceae bacterium]|nr:ABC transporter substrate-binding protein [Stellaceae bacterium]
MGRAVVFGLGVALAAAVTGAAQAESLKVVIPQKGLWDVSMVDFGVKEGIFKAEGLDIEQIYSEGGANNEQAVISGSADMAIGTGTLGIISAYVKGAPIRIISAEWTGVPDLFWYAKADSGMKSLKDAAGKSVAFSAPGSSSNLVLLSLLKYNGVTTAKPTPTGGIPGTLTQVMSGQIDVGWAAPPIPLDQVKAGKLVILAHGSDVPALRNQTVRVNVVRLALLQQHRDVVERFARAYQKSIDWAYANPKATDYYADGLHVSHELAVEARKFYPKSSLQPYEIKGLDQTLRDAYEFKRIPQPMKPDQIAGLITIIKPGK